MDAKLKRVIFLRDVEKEQMLHSQGLEVIVHPLITFAPIFEALDEVTESFIKPFTMVFFTSANGIQTLMKTKKMELLRGKKIYVVGNKTAEVLRECGFEPTLIPDEYSVEGLLKVLPTELKNEVALLLVAKLADELLPRTLFERGAVVKRLDIYQTLPKNLPPIEIQDGDYVVFTSPTIVKEFFTTLYKKQKIVSFCIGKTTQTALSNYFTGEVIVSKQSTMESLTTAITEFRN